MSGAWKFCKYWVTPRSSDTNLWNWLPDTDAGRNFRRKLSYQNSRQPLINDISRPREIGLYTAVGK